MLESWSRLAEYALFNENTTYWASGWFVPYVLARLGLASLAARLIRRLERRFFQSLKRRDSRDVLVSAHHETLRSASYFGERTFFCCARYSFLMVSSGPPTPPRVKQVLLGPLRKIALPLTRRLAELLIRFDQFQDRKHDAFISYACRSRNFRSSDNSECLICPDCKQDMAPSLHCAPCGKKLARADGMLFALSRDVEHIWTSYEKAPAIAQQREQL